MAEKQTSASFLAELHGDDSSEEYGEFRADVNELIEALSGYELVDAVIERVERYALEKYERFIAQGANVRDSDLIDGFRTLISYELTERLSHFITDAHREFIVRAHARGLSTSASVLELIDEDESMNRLTHRDALGRVQLQRVLVLRMSYLKPGTARWPEKKYGAVWREARAAYKQAVTSFPLMSKAEQAALLAKHAARIDYELEEKNHETKDLQALTKLLTQTLESLSKLTEEEESVREMLSPPQLVAVLERLTLELGAPDQKALGGDVQQLVGVLEKLALALKAPVQKTGGNGANALPAPHGNDGENPDEAN